MNVRQGVAMLAAVAAIVGPQSVAQAQIADIANAQAADPVASYVKASGWVQTNDGPIFVELLLDDANAGVRLRSATNADPKIQVLRPYQALEILADRRMQFLWQPLEAWAGPNLERMRDRNLAQLRTAADAQIPGRPPARTSESTVRPKVRAIIQLAGFLTEVGQGAEAERVLQDQLNTMKVKTDGSWSAIEWFSVAGTIASSRWERGDSKGAITQYELIERTLGNSPFAVNATISKASFLAQSGRYADALSTIDALWERWNRDNREYKVSGSLRQFAWIRACALEGLGRHAEAEAAFLPVLQASETRDHHFVIETDDTLQFRGRICMQDVGAVTAMMTERLKNETLNDYVLALQPAYRPPRNTEFWAKIRSNESLTKLALVRMRVLPPEMSLALNGWRRP